VIRKIILSFLGLLFFAYLASPISPFDIMWTNDASFIAKFFFNPIFLSIFLLFFITIWFLISLLLSFFIQTEKYKPDVIISIFTYPFNLVQKISIFILKEKI